MGIGVIKCGIIGLVGLASLAIAGTGAADEQGIQVEYQLNVNTFERVAEDPEYAASFAQRLRAEEARRIAELEEGWAAAIEIGALAEIIDLGDGRGLFVYDAAGIWDPFGTHAEEDGFGSNDSDFGRIFGMGRRVDPMDVGLPASNSRSVWAPDVEGAIGGVASFRNAKDRTTTTPYGVLVENETMGEDGVVRFNNSFYHNDGSITNETGALDADGLIHRFRTETNAEGVIEKSTLYHRNGEDTIYATYDEEGSLVDVERVPNDASDGSATELRDPEYADAAGCVFAWQCDTPTAQEVYEKWIGGANEALTMDEAATIPVNQVDPILTQFDVLSNPGYIDGLYVFDETGSGGEPTTDWGDGVTQY